MMIFLVTKFDYLLTLRIKVKSFLSFLLTFVCSLGTIVSSMKVLIKLLAAWITYIFIHEIMKQNSLTFYSQNKRLDDKRLIGSNGAHRSMSFWRY